MSTSKRFLILLCLSVLTLASCGGGDDEGGAATSTTAASGSVATTAASATSNAPPTEAPTTTTAPTTTEAESGSDAGQAELVFDDGRSWMLNGSCTYTPDKTGPAAALWNVEVTADDGASLIGIMAFPFDPAKTDPVLIGNFVDADERLYTFIESEDVSAGSDLILNLGIHDGIKTFDDPIDINATFTCKL